MAGIIKTIKQLRSEGIEGYFAIKYAEFAKDTPTMQEAYANLADRVTAIINEGTLLEVGPGPAFVSIEISKRIPQEIERIAAFLRITVGDWDRLYDDSRWQYSEYRLIRHIGGACAFLRYDKGVAACEIHAVKPACCAAWQPGRNRPECHEAMAMRRGAPA